MSAAALGAWGGLLAVIGARAAGAPLPPWTAVAAAMAALAAAVAVAGQIVMNAWRGPPVVDFGRDEAVLCAPAEAEVVRAAALLRGTMGGAGYVWRARLALPATVSLWAGVVAGWTILDPSLATVPAWPFVVLVLLAGAAVVLPARPFYYREANDGFLLLHPEDAWIRLERFSSRIEHRMPRGPGSSGDEGPAATPSPGEAPTAVVQAWRSEGRAGPQGEGEP